MKNELRLTVGYTPCYVRQLDSFTRVVLSKCTIPNMYLFNVYFADKQFFSATTNTAHLAQLLMESNLTKDQLYNIVDQISAAELGPYTNEVTIRF